MQAIGIWYTPDMIKNFSMVEEEMKKAKAQNFNILIAFFRWMHINVMDDEAVNTVEQSVKYAHKLGMKFSIDTDPTWWQTDFTEKCPDAALRLIKRVETRVIHGKFSKYVRVPGAAIVHTQEMFDKIIAVFVEDSRGKYRFVDPQECNIKFEVGRSWDGLGNEKGVVSFDRVTGAVPGDGNRRIVIYVAYKVFAYVDFAHSAFLSASKRLLDKYKHIPLDGIGWDEPGRIGGIKDNQTYRAGNGFLKFFRKYKSYDLIPSLIYLDDSSNEKMGTKVRNDYYDALTEMNVRAQRDHNEYARKLFGKDILLGTHQTWTPLGDVMTGYSDYFRTGKVLNPVWVDVFTTHEEDTKGFDEMLHVYCLGDSLRKEYGIRRVYSNDYFIPIQPDQIDFFTRMKMLFDISWFYLWVGQHTEYMPNLNNRHASDIGKAVETLNAFQGFLGDDYRTLTDTAVFYSPVGLYAFPSVNFGISSKNLLAMRYHLVRTFLRAGRCFDFVGQCSLERASVIKEKFQIDDRVYSRLVLPWVTCIPRVLQPIISGMVNKGVQVIFAGPPMVKTAETGDDISEEFFKMFDVEPFTMYDFMHFMEEVYPNPPECYPFSHKAFPLAGTGVKVIGRSHDGDPAVIQAKEHSNLIYDSSLDTLNPATYALMSDTKDTGIKVYVNNGYYRIFERIGHRNSFIVLVVAGMRSLLNVNVRIGDASIEIHSGRYAAFKVENGKINHDIIFSDVIQTE